jgi:signal peptidase I
MARPHRSDTRILIYRLILRTAAIAAVLFLVKFTLLDIVHVESDAMSPTIVAGDRLLVMRLPCLPLVRALLCPGRGAPVLFRSPLGYRGCLRVAGVSGDTVAVENGVLGNTRLKAGWLPVRSGEQEILPADFSPRDFTPTLRIPAPGEVLALDSLDLYGFFCALGVIRQENPARVIAIKPSIVMDGGTTNDYFISDFALYRGPIDSVPDKLRYDWFFWKRLLGSVAQSEGGHEVGLSFAVEKNGARLNRYPVKRRYMFLAADNRAHGFDSRYFGPVAVNACFARPLCVLWSLRREGKRNAITVGRILKFIR